MSALPMWCVDNWSEGAIERFGDIDDIRVWNEHVANEQLLLRRQPHAGYRAHV